MPNKKKTLGSIRAKAGLPAKAGRRRPHNIMKDKNGNYVAAPFKARPKAEKVEKVVITFAPLFTQTALI